MMHFLNEVVSVKRSGTNGVKAIKKRNRMSDKDRLEQIDNETKAKGYLKMYVSGSVLYSKNLLRVGLLYYFMKASEKKNNDFECRNGIYFSNNNCAKCPKNLYTECVDCRKCFEIWAQPKCRKQNIEYKSLVLTAQAMIHINACRWIQSISFYLISIMELFSLRML